MAKRRPGKDVPPLPKDFGPTWSAKLFAQQWDRYLKAHLGMRSGQLVDLLRRCVLRLNTETNEWEPVSGTSIYAIRKGEWEPLGRDMAAMARVLGCRIEDFLT
jgi:hypothetical protein